MSIGWVIFAIFILFICTVMVTLLIMASCEYKDEIEDNDGTPEEDKDD